MKKLLITLAFLVPASSFAQGTPPQNNSKTTLQELRREAWNLTLMSRMSAEDQEKFKTWQESAKQLRQKVQDLRIKALTAYNEALKAQNPPNEARLLAQKAVIDDRIALSRQMNDLRTTFQELARKYPFLVAQSHKQMKSHFGKEFLKQRMHFQKKHRPF
ncbi:hypothetical protein [Deinococcus cellulosilyticus]|uniref:LTXXQ motif family protein n=1 Tax=Deinococcus cellulosilyticus (strain DSM 18568 / NBRC 106333 / KACC 11606 / 5516J-15) TaxID=1223518 RepID=A0A511N033_DEIC1|nr:hypothetical protein [Deinococcus cellulosilyticus]GEM45797.1 hypothetical protein DC3_14320 [Deinococcus cellulosilyticus NBRC 106333 = KACC 11606]